MQFADANAAAGHLLRHLHDARALQKNPLVSHFFADQEPAGPVQTEALARVHELVTATAEKIFGGDAVGRGFMHKRRQLEIVMRCDIRGELHKTVQVDMGLGARQFYRERQKARLQLAKAFEALVPATLSETGPALDPRGLAISAIRATRVHADDALAVRLIRDELDASPDADFQFDLLATLAEIQAEAGEFTDARKAIAAAHAMDRSDYYSRGRVQQVEALLASIEGRFLEAVRRCDSAIGLYEQLPLPRTIEQEEQLAATLLVASLTKHGVGYFEEALTSLHAAREIIERRPELPLLLKVQLLKHLGASQMVLPGSRTMVESHLLEARAIAQRNGLVREAVSCTFYISRLHENSAERERERDRALQVGRDALAHAKKVNGRAVYAWFCLTFAGRELRAGFYHNVINLARTARACNDSEVCISIANATEADALLHLNDPDRAYVLALSAIDTFRRAEHTIYLGNALRVVSEAAFRIGRIEYARYAIQESLSLLERYGHAVPLTSALRASEAINGDARTR